MILNQKGYTISRDGVDCFQMISQYSIVMISQYYRISYAADFFFSYFRPTGELLSSRYE